VFFGAHTVSSTISGRRRGRLLEHLERPKPDPLFHRSQWAALARFADAEGMEFAAEFVDIETGKGTDALNRRPHLAALAEGVNRRPKLALTQFWCMTDQSAPSNLA
jgi:hypothetical protein